MTEQAKSRYILTGYVLTAVSSVTFSAKSILAKYIYAYNVTPETLLALRFIMALPFFYILMYFMPSEKVGRRDLLYLMASGLLGVYIAAMTDFHGLLYIDATLERIILYTYPAMVIIITAVFLKEGIDKSKIIAIALTYLGLAFALKVFSGGLSGHLFGAALVLISATVYSGSYVLTQVVSLRVSPVKVAAYTTTTATCAFLATWRFEAFPTEPNAWWLIFAVAFFSTFIPFITLAVGIKRIGASKAAITSTVGPVATAIAAALLLNEEMTLSQLFGMALVILGVFIISIKKAPIKDCKIPR
ncbi:MAG: DMT family transporter [Deltaproteobacteria bacterium]|nr:DMT family transporter [Deltaproteobacteria bacterium]